MSHAGDRRVVTLSSGLQVTDLGATWCDLAPIMSLVELVQVGDAILNREGWDAERLAQAAASHPGRRGKAALDRALPRLRPHSRSPRETFARLMFQDWGLPEPELNVDVYDDTGWIACVDFRWGKKRVIAEYYGEVHGQTWAEDLARVARLQDAGYTVVVITKYDFRRRAAELRARLERALNE